MVRSEDLPWDIGLSQFINNYYPVLPTTPMVCVEIGSFEGIGSNIIYLQLCRNADSVLYCIDPLDDEYVKGSDKLAYWNNACVGQRGRFYQNTKDLTNMKHMDGLSDAMIPLLTDNTVDFVYIDGDHTPEQVYKDAINMWSKMKKNSFMLFDDYGFDVNGVYTAIGIDKFLKEKENQYELLFKGWQLAIRVL